MDSLLDDGVTWWLPANTNDVATLIQDAKANNEIIRLRGAGHSFPLSFNLDQASASGRPYKYVMLSKMYNVQLNPPGLPQGCVKVDAGCHLGMDPWDPTGLSKEENSLTYLLDQAGLALPDLGGITHQTVGGFLSTSSSGGSTQFAFEESLLSIDIMYCDATGVHTRTFNKPPDSKPDLNDPFYATGVGTLGLFGIIVSATFQCIQKFYIEGCEASSVVNDTINNCEIDLFGDGTNGKPSYQQFLEQKQTAPYPSDTVHFPYSRMLWWPQNDVNTVVLWKAQQTDQAGAEAWAKNAWTNYNSKNNPPPAPPAPPTPWPALKEYQEVQWVFGSTTPLTLAADLMFSAIGNWPDWLLATLGNTTEYEIAKTEVDLSFYTLIYPWIMNNLFLTAGKTQYFSDTWFNGLPMDNQMSDRLFPVWFTELWIPISQTQSVMNTLKSFYAGKDENGCQNTGAFCVEIYAAKNSDFWMCPAYQTDVIRIDVFWFGNNKGGDPTSFYQKFWDLLAPFNFRPHWGKYLPDGNSTLGASYLAARYPKWNDWMNLRNQMDPYQLFVNDYWRGHLNIPNPQ